MAKTKFCQGLSDISDSYMGFILDEWGTLHDGEVLYDGVIDCLKELRERKKTIVLLSNKMERADQVKPRLKKMGLGPSLYDKIITPAEMMFEGFGDNPEGVFQGLGKRAYVFTRRGDVSALEGTDIDIVEDIDQADFVLILGMDYPARTLEHYEPIIRKAIQRRLKAITPEPESLDMIGGTNILTSPVLLARRYEDSGGIVHRIGKPHAPVFRHCIEFFQQKEIYPSHTVMLGDSMDHDILGGHYAGLDTCLFKSGIHAANFAHCQTLKEVDNALKNLMAVYNNVMPRYLVDEFRWGKALPDRKHKKRKQPAG